MYNNSPNNHYNGYQNNNIYDNDYSIFNRRKKHSKVPQSNHLASAIASVLSSVVLTIIFSFLFSSFGVVEYLIGNYFDNYIILLLTAVGYNIYTNLVKAIIIIVCYSKKKDFTEDLNFQILYSKFDIFGGIGIIAVMVFALVNMYVNGIFAYYLSSWAMLIPYLILAILGLSRIIKGVNRINKLKKIQETLNSEETQYANRTNTYSNIPNTPPVNHIPQNNNYQQNTYQKPQPNTQKSKTNKFCTECGMRLEKGEKTCPVCGTKIP